MSEDNFIGISGLIGAGKTTLAKNILNNPLIIDIDESLETILSVFKEILWELPKMKLFVFAIGGTGSRVLKSMIMLCAAGVRPVDANGKPLQDVEIVPIIIDPHKSNADLKRTERLLSAYSTLREKLYGKNANANGFFATKISSLKEVVSSSQVPLDDSFIFNLAAVENYKFRDFISYNTMNEPNQALTSLLFADYQLENKMSIGFVGSPNIGSVALNGVKDSNEFKAFANVFADGDRIFFISSIFGGTGAAGFPIIVKNIRQARNIDAKNKAFLQRAPIGGLTVLPYFSLMESEDKKDKRIDNADFVVKTQSALEYYNNTLTGNGRNAVNAIFYLGDHGHNAPYAYDPGDKRDQHDPAHLIELVGAMAPFKFLSLSDSELSDPVTGEPLATKAFEYGLEKDTDFVDFSSFGQETRQLVYRPLVKLHLLYIFLRTDLNGMIGQGFTEDAPKITREFTGTQFYRVLTQQFFDSYIEWLTELLHNRRHVTLFNEGEMEMAKAIHKVVTKKSLFGYKKVDNDVFKAEMNRLSRDNNRYGSNAELKLMDLFYTAAEKIITERYDNIN